MVGLGWIPFVWFYFDVCYRIFIEVVVVMLAVLRLRTVCQVIFYYGEGRSCEKGKDDCATSQKLQFYLLQDQPHFLPYNLVSKWMHSPSAICDATIR